MSFEKVQAYFETFGMGGRCINLKESSATVALAARALGTEEARIAKTLSFLAEEVPVVIVTAGDARIDNHKYKMLFHKKPKMIPGEECEKYIGHRPGGVCPFCLPPTVDVYLDISLKRFDVIYPAAGTDHSAVKLMPEELEKYIPYSYRLPDNLVRVCCSPSLQSPESYLPLQDPSFSQNQVC